MGVILGILSQVDNSSATEYSLLAKPPSPTVPPASSGQLPPAETILVEQILVCNRNNSPGTFRIAVTLGGNTASNADYLYYDAVIRANETLSLNLGLTLSRNDILRGITSGGMTFTVIGQRT